MIQYPCFDFSTFSREEREDYARSIRKDSAIISRAACAYISRRPGNARTPRLQRFSSFAFCQLAHCARYTGRLTH